MNNKDKLEVIKELFLFVREKKEWILIPVLIMLVVIIAILFFVETPALLPFFYAIF